VSQEHISTSEDAAERRRFQDAHVLVVDDEKGVRGIVRAALERHGFQVQEASNGEEALEMLAHGEPDLVLLDLVMPGMDGAELFETLRKQQPDVPVVILTGYPKADIVKRILASGPATVLTKPFVPEELLDVAEAALKSKTVGRG